MLVVRLLLVTLTYFSLTKTTSTWLFTGSYVTSTVSICTTCRDSGLSFSDGLATSPFGVTPLVLTISILVSSSFFEGEVFIGIVVDFFLLCRWICQLVSVYLWTASLLSQTLWQTYLHTLQQDPWLRIGWWQRWQGRGFLNVLQRNAWLGPCVTLSSCLSSRCIGGLIVGAFFFSCWHKHDLIHGIFPNLTKLAPYPRSFRLVKLVTSSTKPRQATWISR
jgi:hypothetical protein